MRTLLVLSFASLLSPALAQEICNNAIDDDADGLIDLNDTTDCACTNMIGGEPVESIIPNPSFEDYNCLPQSYSELNCADTWQQATNATSDYFHALAYMPVVVPQPVPDGDACVGGYLVRNYQGIDLHYMEYIGACLPEPLLAGEEYSFQLRIAGQQINAFLDATFPITVGPVDITLFGLATCPTFPVGSDSGCPQGWTVLGTVTQQPDGAWHQVTITFTPTTDINAVMIGGPCDPPADYDIGQFALDHLPYFFYDDLTLNQSALFTSVTLTGSSCTDNIVLIGHPDSLATSYQWYNEGVALVGQTDSVLNVSVLDLPLGEYQFLTSVNDTACAIASILVTAPAPVSPLIGASPLSGCPPLSVNFSDNTSGNVTGCTWAFGDGGNSTECDPTHVYTAEGTYDVSLTVTMANGCTYDTTYSDLITVVPPPTASFTVTPQPAPADAPLVTFTDNSSPDVISWQWDFDTIPPFASNAENPVVTYPSQQGAYPVTLIVTNAAGCTDTVHATVIVVPTGDLDMPNVFSPNGDSDNDRFIPLDEFPGEARLSIYNRWGQEIYTTTSITSGWNGTIRGSDAPAGTYYWIVENLNSTDDRKFLTGHVTLLR
jgi:gliding motility-associated-like protein